MASMIDQSKQSWDKGNADAMRGARPNCPQGLDELAYSSGYIAGETQRARRPPRAIAFPKTNKDV
jgi:hypothetical protein